MSEKRESTRLGRADGSLAALTSQPIKAYRFGASVLFCALHVLIRNLRAEHRIFADVRDIGLAFADHLRVSCFACQETLLTSRPMKRF